MRLNKFINIQTELPGPKAHALLEKKNQHVPRGPFNTVNSFIQSAQGAVLTDIDGNTFLDFAGAIGTLNVGHCPPKVVDAITEQIQKYIHPCFHVMMYEPYVELAEKLNEITPGNHHKKTFFLNSGAEAVENAIKIARKYTKRKGIISFERGFHGRTYMSMSLTSKVKPYKDGFGPFAPEVYKMPYPYYYRAPHGMSNRELDDFILNEFESFFLSEAPADDIAAVIMEPVQGEGGFVIPSAYFVQKVKNLCEKHGMLFIADEIQTGFGRTGKMFAIEHFGVIPDLMTMSKSIGAGIPISAVTGRAEVMDAPNIGEIGGTYGGSPIGCVAALNVIDMIKEEGLLQRANIIGEQFSHRFNKLKDSLEFLGDVRTIGAMSALEIVKNKETKEPDKPLTVKILQKIHENGVILMSAGIHGNIIRMLYPLVTTDEQLEEGFQVIEDVLKSI